MHQLIIFPHAGGSEVSFMAFQRRLLPEIDTFVVPYPGRGKRFRDPFANDVPQLVADCLENLAPRLGNKPFSFLGHSFGALMAYECMLQMQRIQMPLPEIAFLTGRGAPSAPLTSKPKHNMPEAELISYLAGIGGLPAELAGNHEFLSFYLPIIRNDLRLNEQYVYSPSEKLKVPLALMNGTADTGINRLSIAEWNNLTYVIKFEEEFEGDHFFLIHNQKVTDKLISYYKSTLL